MQPSLGVLRPPPIRGSGHRRSVGSGHSILPKSTGRADPRPGGDFAFQVLLGLSPIAQLLTNQSVNDQPNPAGLWDEDIRMAACMPEGRENKGPMTSTYYHSKNRSGKIG